MFLLKFSAPRKLRGAICAASQSPALSPPSVVTSCPYNVSVHHCRRDEPSNCRRFLLTAKASSMFCGRGREPRGYPIAATNDLRAGFKRRCRVFCSRRLAGLGRAYSVITVELVTAAIQCHNFSAPVILTFGDVANCSYVGITFFVLQPLRITGPGPEHRAACR